MLITTQQALEEALELFIGIKAPINREYSGYAIMAQSEQDYEGKKRSIDRGNTYGFVEMYWLEEKMHKYINHECNDDADVLILSNGDVVPNSDENWDKYKNQIVGGATACSICKRINTP